LYEVIINLPGRVSFPGKAARILFVGHTGVGKTEIVNTVLGAQFPEDALFDKSKSTIEAATARARYRKKIKIEFTDTPGHETFQQELKEELVKIPDGEFVGIVNVVCYGYNEPKSQNLRKKIPQFTSPGMVNPDFTQAYREDEIGFLLPWLTVAGLEKKHIKWVITAVNKADLWYENQEKVERYYSNDPRYGGRIRNVFGDKYEVLKVSATDRGLFFDQHVDKSFVEKQILDGLNENFINRIIALSKNAK